MNDGARTSKPRRLAAPENLPRRISLGLGVGWEHKSARSRTEDVSRVVFDMTQLGYICYLLGRHFFALFPLVSSLGLFTVLAAPSGTRRSMRDRNNRSGCFPSL